MSGPTMSQAPAAQGVSTDDSQYGELFNDRELPLYGSLSAWR